MAQHGSGTPPCVMRPGSILCSHGYGLSSDVAQEIKPSSLAEAQLRKKAALKGLGSYNMTILYGLVARGKEVLSEYTAVSGNFPTITRLLLAKIPDQDSKMSYVYDQYVFHYIVEDRITYLCMSDDQHKRRIPFAFLEDVKTRFKAAYGERAYTAIAFAMNEDFGRVLQRQMDVYNSNSADQFAALQKKLDDVKHVMIQNVEMVLERGEKLELLVDKTTQLQHQAFKFEKSSKRLRNAMFWNRVKCYGLVGLILSLIIFFITGLACGGFNFKHCGGKR